MSREPQRSSTRRSTPSRRRRADAGPRVLGVEVDDSQVVAVLLVGGEAQAVYEGDGATAQTRLADVVTQAGPVDAVRVSLPVVGAQSAPVTITPDMTSRARFEEVVHQQCGTTPSTTVVAGIFDLAAVSVGQTSAGLALTAPRGAVEEVYATLGRASARVAVPVAHSAPLEGLSLALRQSHAELTLVVAGRPVATHELPCGGLGPLEQRLGRGSTVGTTRLASALLSRSDDLHRTDPQALSELDQYLRLVVAQVSDITNRWTLAGLAVPTSLYVHGRGATADRLTDVLTAAGLRRSAPGAPDRALTLVEPRRRPRLITAYLAAAGHETARATSTFVNNQALDDLTSARARAARARRTRTFSLAAAVLVAAVALPLAPATVNALRTSGDLDTRINAAASGSAMTPEDVQAQLDQLDNRERQVPTATTHALAAALAPFELLEAHVSHDDITATVRTDEPAAVLDGLASAGLSVRTSQHDRDTDLLRIDIEQTGDTP